MKKIISLIIILTLVSAMLSGCGDNGSADVSGTPAQNITEAPPNTKELVTDEPAGLYPLTEETIEFSLYTLFSPDFPSAVDSFDDYSAIAKAEEITNVHIDWNFQSSGDAFLEKLQIILSTGEYPDLMTALYRNYNDGPAAAIANEVVVDLAPYLEEYAPNYNALVQSDADLRRVVYDDNGGVANFLAVKEVATPPFGLFIRQDWLDELSLETPSTISELTEVLTAFKVNYNADAPYVNSADGQNGTAIVSAFGVNGFQPNGSLSSGHNSMYQIDGTVYSSLISDGYRDYLALMNEWYNSGLLSADFASTESFFFGDTRVQSIVSGNTGLFYMTPNHAPIIQAISGGTLVYAGLADPTLNEGDQLHFADTQRMVTSSSIAVTTACDNVEVAIQWCDFWFSAAGYMLWNFGVEDESYTIGGSGEIEFTELLINNEWDVDVYTAFGAYTMTYLFGASYIPYNRTTITYTDAQVEAMENWISNQDGERMLPNFTIDDRNYNAAMTDIETYASERVAKFISGELPLSDWDGYVEALISIGIEDCIVVYQDAYDNYLSR